jgi:hypothetical protein
MEAKTNCVVQHQGVARFPLFMIAGKPARQSGLKYSKASGELSRLGNALSHLDSIHLKQNAPPFIHRMEGGSSDFDASVLSERASH